MKYLLIDIQRLFINVIKAIAFYIFGETDLEFNLTFWLHNFKDLEDQTILLGIQDPLAMFSMYKLNEDLYLNWGDNTEYNNRVQITSELLTGDNCFVELCRDKYGMLHVFIQGLKNEETLFRDYFDIREQFVLGSIVKQ